MSRLPPLAVAVVTSIAIGVVAAGPATAEEDDYTIRLKSRVFVPVPRVDTKALQDKASRTRAQERVHFFAQFKSLPDRAALAGEGVILFEYVGGNAYVVSASLDDLDRVSMVRNLRWAGPILATDKMSADLKDGAVGPWAVADDGDLLLTVQVHGDVSIEEAIAIVEGLGGRVVDRMPTIRAVTALFAPGREWEVADQDQVQFVTPVALPLEDHNDGARAATNVDALQAAPYNLDGTGVTVLVYDSGTVDTGHIDFTGRVVEVDGDATETIRDHSTHVTGIVAGSGANSNGFDSAGDPNGGTAGQWAGMAPAVDIRSFGSTGTASDFYNGNGGDLNADFTTAIGNGVDLATMSQGNNVYQFNPPPCGQLGDYSSTAQLIDQIVTGSIAGQRLIFFESPGNERGTGPTGTAPCGQFETIASPATAKNSIAVGAINSNDNSLTGFTSLGPTDDGRVKPDITGPGCQSTGDLGITSPSFIDGGGGDLDAGETQNAYVVKCGTSMSTPAAAGAGVLLIEQWRALHGAGTRPMPHTVKALMVHTAADLGNAGPDYSFGWGAFDAQAAVDLVIADSAADLIHVSSVDDGDDVHYTFNSDGAADVQVTVVWDDPPAALLAANTLVNDLDLRLTAPDDTMFMPFVLDPANPGNPAAIGDDGTNNVEMVVGAAAAGTWTVTVQGDAVPSGPQEYTLITPEDAEENNRRPNADANGPYTTDEGANASLDASGSSDPDGDSVTYEWDLDNDGQFDDAAGVVAVFDLVGQDGVYPIAVKVTDEHGAFDIDETTVTVNNVAPSVALASTSPQDENSSIAVTATLTDPGWLDVLSATIDWGDGSPTEPMALTGSENLRPEAVYTFSAEHIYGDNGNFTATVCGYDDDAMTCETIDLGVLNVAPTAEIDLSAWIDGCGGESALIAHAGEELTFNGRSTDPGSDDLTLVWSWGDGSPDVTIVSLVNPPLPDPFPSPSIQPRDVSDTQAHTYDAACRFVMTFSSTDDDGGSASVSEDVLIFGNAELIRSAGYWYNQFRKLEPFSEDELLCYLAIVTHMSSVFSEETMADTVDDAKGMMHPANSRGAIEVQFDRQLMALWLNLANGAIEIDEPVDTDFDGIPNRPLLEVLCAAEEARLLPAPRAELENWKDILEAINLLDS